MFSIENNDEEALNNSFISGPGYFNGSVINSNYLTPQLSRKGKASELKSYPTLKPILETKAPIKLKQKKEKM